MSRMAAGLKDHQVTAETDHCNNHRDRICECSCSCLHNFHVELLARFAMTAHSADEVVHLCVFKFDIKDCIVVVVSLERSSDVACVICLRSHSEN
ncbi:hypothetical protein Mapa_003104 [Marchantia paleacea]|nr:hypothetical protein Mapa_003104 [Marchantia paleacea]